MKYVAATGRFYLLHQVHAVLCPVSIAFCGVDKLLLRFGLLLAARMSGDIFFGTGIE